MEWTTFQLFEPVQGGGKTTFPFKNFQSYLRLIKKGKGKIFLMRRRKKKARLYPPQGGINVLNMEKRGKGGKPLPTARELVEKKKKDSAAGCGAILFP